MGHDQLLMVLLPSITVLHYVPYCTYNSRTRSSIACFLLAQIENDPTTGHNMPSCILHREAVVKSYWLSRTTNYCSIPKNGEIIYVSSMRIMFAGGGGGGDAKRRRSRSTTTSTYSMCAPKDLFHSCTSSHQKLLF